MVDRSYWNEFYKKGEVPREPSTFAGAILSKISTEYPLLELGCGNGRDSFFFASKGIKTYSCDISETVKDLQQTHGNPEFFCADFTALETPFKDSQLGTVYSRFTLHSVPAEGASRALQWSYNNLRMGGQLFIEVRSVLDPMCGKGTKVERERDAWINTHYRRFIRKDELVAELEGLGFKLQSVVEANNLAIYKDDNPVLIRIHAIK